MEYLAETAQANATVMRNPPTLHHIGFVVASIQQVGVGFARSLHAIWDGEIIHDPQQQARVAFLRHANAATPMLELVEPAGESSPLHRFVSRGGGLHHICYEVDSLDDQMKLSRASGALIVKQPLPAVAFGGRRIAWVFISQKLLVEYLER
jgi:methylmalonyl-CoA/ethylmalonyl-CoA epimerase